MSCAVGLIFALAGSACINRASGPRPYAGTQMRCPGFVLPSPLSGLMPPAPHSGAGELVSAGPVSVTPKASRQRAPCFETAACALSSWSDDSPTRGKGDFAGRRASRGGRGGGAGRWTVRRRAGDSEERASDSSQEASRGMRQQRSEDIGAALDVHSPKQGGTDEARALGSNNSNHEANSKLAFETLAEIAALSAARGKCCAAHLEEILSRMRLGQILPRRPFYFSLLKAASVLVSRNSAKRELVHAILGEMKAAGIDPDQATTSLLLEMISSESAQRQATASDVWWVLEQVGGGISSRAVAPRAWVPLMKIMAAAAKHGGASSHDALALVERSREYFGLLRTVPSIYLCNAALLVLVNEKRFLAGGVSPGQRLGHKGARVVSGEPLQDAHLLQARSSDVGKTPWDILEVMDDMGVAPDAVTFNTALSFYVPASVGSENNHAREQGIALMIEMRKRDVRPTASSYNTLMQIIAYSTLDGAAPDPSIARAFSSSPAAAAAAALSPSHVLAPQDNAKRAAAALAQVDEMMIRMRKELVLPDSVSYDTLLNVAVAACKLSVVVTGDDMERWLKEMEAEGVRASRNTLPTMTVLMPAVAAAGKISAAQARRIMQQLKALGGVPSLEGYNRLLTTTARACRHGAASLSDAGHVLQDMDADHIAINVYTFNALFDVLAAAAALPRAQVSMADVSQVIQRLHDERVAADTVTLNSALGVVLALARRRSPRASMRNVRDLMQVFEGRLGVVPDAISYTLYLEAIAADAHRGLAGLEDAEAVLEEMTSKGLQPSRISWNVVMSVVARSARLKGSAMAEADGVLERMAAARLAPDSFTISSYCCCARLAKIAGSGGDDDGSCSARASRQEPPVSMHGELKADRSGVGGRAGGGGVSVVWDEDDDERGRRHRWGRDVLAGSSLSLADEDHLRRLEWSDGGRKVEPSTLEDEEDDDGFVLEGPYSNFYLDSFLYSPTSTGGSSSGEEGRDGEDCSGEECREDEDWDGEEGEEIVSRKASGGAGDFMGKTKSESAECKVQGSDKREADETVSEEVLRGWSGGDFKAIRGYFDYTYVPEEDHDEDAGEEEVGGWRKEKGKPVQEQKVRETYVLKAWRLLRALPEKERSTQVYAAMMEAFACIGRQAESRGLLDLAASHGCAPDTLMFNAALRTCGDEQEVRMVLRLMQDAGVSGDAMTKKLLASVQ